MSKFKTSDFHFDLPSELVATFPLPTRSASRLLVINRQTKEISHHSFKDLPHFLYPDDLMVFNNTRVIPARLYGQKESGGKLECLIERVLDLHRVLAHIKASKSPKVGSEFYINARSVNPLEAIKARVLSRQDALFEVAFNQPVEMVLKEAGEIPLPHYMERAAESLDLARYQTVYAKEKGAVAAPTAGLHFDEAILAEINAKLVRSVEVTLHVGAGTFQPVRVDDLSQHHMHSEWMNLSKEAAELINQAPRVLAVGTTSVRCLETASQQGKTIPYQGETDIFIYPGYAFQRVDALLTNFHLPQSTLIMLVAAFAGYDLVMQAYQEAVKARYRFYSYGDAMLII